MNRLKQKNKTMKYMNEFPIVIVIAVVFITIIFSIIYLNIKPYETVQQNGYMVLSKNMTYNLISNNKSLEEKDEFDVGAVSVATGDYIYKQMDTYYVGVEKKQEIDYEYPLYSRDGLTIYNRNEDAILINRNFEKLKGYSGLSLNYGILYNDGDLEPADEIDYLFLYLNNSIYINTQTMVIKTVSNEYNISMHSPMYFDTKYVNYYSFDGKNFKYNTISDIYYDSLVKIGDVTLTYEEFMIQMGLVEIKNPDEEEIIEEKQEEIVEEEQQEEIVEENKYVKPNVKVLDFTSSVYYINSKLTITDPSGVITSNPMFEIYTYDDNKLFLRKKFNNSGIIKISGLSSNKKYKIVGTYKYKNELGLTVVSTFYEGEIFTKNVSELDEIKINSELGEIYSDRIEIKNLNITSSTSEVLEGIRKIVLEVKKENTDEIKKTNLSYNQIRDLINGEKVTISSTDNLKSNTVYEYHIKFYDKDNNELKTTGNVSGIVKTAKEVPSVKISSNIDDKNNIAKINIQTKNPDSIYIKNFKYQLYSSSGYIVETGELNYLDESSIDLTFENLDYNTKYILEVTGLYDLEDGKGEQNLNIKNDFLVSKLNSFTAWYEIVDKENDITKNSIKANINISKTTKALELNNTEIVVYLADKDGKDILDEKGNLKYFKKYTKEEYTKSNSTSYSITNIFEGLESDTEYNIKVRLSVKQLEKDISIEKILTPSIKTLAEDSYINVKNKLLVGNNLYLTLEIIDNDDYITQKEVFLEIYNGKLEEKTEEKYIYRKKYNIEENNEIILNLPDYTEENYTVFVTANPYNGVEIDKEIAVKELNEESKKYINLSRTITGRIELYEQMNFEKYQYNLNTKIGISYSLNDTLSNMYLIDCAGDLCTTIGYIDQFQNIKSLSERYNGSELSNEKTIISILNTKKDVNHNFYIGFEKTKLNSQVTYSHENIQDNFYIISQLEYNTKSEIYKLEKANDFFKIQNNKHYVVINDIDFINEDIITSNNKINKFNGVIDFQGYTVNLYENNESNVMLFDTIEKEGILKNVVLNYNLEYQGLTTGIGGFLRQNDGILDNIIINVNQKYDTGVGNMLALLARSNYGQINNFVICLNSDIHLYGSDSALAVAYNAGGAKLSNGYVYSKNNSKIILHDISTTHGTFVFMNSGIIKNVYNLVDIILNENEYNGFGLSAITPNNRTNGIIENTISVATSTQITSTNSMRGPIGENLGTVKNNYYFDTNIYNKSYSSKSSKKISISTLRNKNSWEIILNKDNNFIVVPEYYPILKMNDFMNDKQEYIKIIGNAFSKSIDILSSEVINNNKETGSGKVKIYVSNPNKFQIEEIVVEKLTSKILKQEYNDELQMSILELELTLENDNDRAKTDYNIVSLKYLDAQNGKQEILYSENNYRILEIEMYRRVYDYEDLIKAMKNGENIYLLSDIKTGKVNSFPDNYSSILDGNEKTIDFSINGEKQTINRSYFINNLFGTIKNLQIKGIHFKAPGTRIGFIKFINEGIVNNVDIRDCKYEIENKESASTMHVGGLTASTYAAKIERLSTNNIEIIKNDNSASITDIYVGGIAGDYGYSTINNSYSYNLKIYNLNKSYVGGDSGIGGIVGRTKGTSINNCYSSGNISTDYLNLGGIVGLIENSQIQNNYSAINIISEGNYVGGIVGEINNFENTNLSNNLFVGNLINKNSNYFYSSIVPVTNPTQNISIFDNYSLETENKFNDVLKVKNINFLTEFDKSESFKDNIDKFPSLKSSSFVEQQIEKDGLEGNNNEINYEITYVYNEDNEDNKCNLNEIKNVNNLDSNYEHSELYDNACADYAVLTIYDNDTNYQLQANDQLTIEKKDDNSYILKPKLYLNYYDVKFIDEKSKEVNETLDLSFYKKISNMTDWNDLSSEEYTNIILTNDINFSSKIENKKLIRNLLGNGYSITMLDENQSIIENNDTLIQELIGNMIDVNFSEFNIKGARSGLGIIYKSSGNIENCSFKNITITNQKGKNRGTAIVGVNNGVIKNINLDNIKVEGNIYTSSLAAYNSTNKGKRILITDIKANKITVIANPEEDKNGIYAGGIIGRAEHQTENVSIDDFEIRITNQEGKGAYIGGIIGVGDCKKNCHALNGVITLEKESSNIGGIGGYAYDEYIDIDSAKVDNVIISGDISSEGYIGGLFANGRSYLNCSVNELTIGKKVGEEYVPLDSNYIGGFSGYNIAQVINSSIKNSYISGNNNVGGLSGKTRDAVYGISKNLVLDTFINAAGTDIGGLIGNYNPSSLLGSTAVHNNIVLRTDITSNNNAGGIIGNLRNESVNSQKISFKNNLVISSNITGSTTGGLIGYLYQIPHSDVINFDRSLFYGNTTSGRLIGDIGNTTTIVDPKYEPIKNLSNKEEIIDKFVEISGFKEYKENSEKNYQINSKRQLEESIVRNSSFTFPQTQGKYFPIFENNYPRIETKELEPLPFDMDVNQESQSIMMFSSMRMLRNYSNAYNNQIDIDYNIYTSGVNSINIEFSNTDSNSYFYYEIGDYKSNYIPINNRTYTITYDFKNSINIYVSNGFNYKNSKIEPKELVKTVSYINGKTYYLQNKILYGETKTITGEFVNLYKNEALTSDGKIYNVITKKERNSNIDYNILDITIPLYETIYKDNFIKTYYNYSTVNGVEKNLQLFVKNGNLNSISNSLDNKKDMYIIDYYNNNEIQIILNNDGKLYSIKHNINYPSDIENSEISELYSDIYSKDNITILKYESGAIYTFNYRTGKLLFTNVSNEYSSFLDYVKDKVGNSNKNSTIENIKGHDKYSEIETLKNKIADVSLEEANDKIYSTNNALNNSDNYITVYNDLTQSYDVYKISSILNNSIEIESETDKMYNNYELVKFYKTMGKIKTKESLSGIIIFAISIISIFVALVLLVRHRKLKKGGNA